MAVRGCKGPSLGCVREWKFARTATTLMIERDSELLGFWMYPSFGILKTREHDVSETGSVGVPLHMRKETNPASETLCFFWFLEYRTMDKVRKPSNFECYTPSSEPFSI
jgi:hypothetical protein